MARPTPTGKQSVRLTPPAARVSRIRRDPPQAVKDNAIVDPEERDKWDVMVGVPLFALSLIVILFGFGIHSGRPPSEPTVELRVDE